MHRWTPGIVLVSLLAACGGGSSDGAGGTNAVAGSSSGGLMGGNAAGGSASGIGGSSSKSGSSTGGAIGGGNSSGKARGAVSLNILAPAGCSLTPHYEELPLTAMGHAVTATEKGPGIEDDGRQSDGSPATVACQWIGDRAPYLIQAGLTAGAGKAARLLSFGVTIDAGMSASGSAVVTLPDDKQFMGDCTFNAIEVDNAARSIWGGFSCDTFVPFEGADPCALGPSYFFFENCE